MPAIRYWLWLSAAENVSVQAKAALVEHYGDAEAAYFAPDGEYKRIAGISEKDAAILEKRDLSASERILADCDRDGIEIITMGDTRYPKRLRNIFAPPTVLYVKGKLPDVDSIPSIAVIGTRSASPYGIKMGLNMAFEISKCGGIVISGLTEGVDRAAARGCLLAGGTCIGVLGTAHGEEYSLQRDVISAGALVSEYPPGTSSRRSFFRERNRISSGLSHGVVVVEAPEGSGALLFAEEAVEQGREIFAVPGNADAPNSAGTLMLIKQGAKPAACGWDVMSEFEAIYPESVHKPSGRLTVPPDTVKDLPQTERQGRGEKKEKKPKPESKAPQSRKSGNERKSLREQLGELSEEQLAIVTAIDRGETHIDDIIEATGLGTAKVLSQLTILEIKGYIRRSAGRRVSLNIKTK